MKECIFLIVQFLFSALLLLIRPSSSSTVIEFHATVGRGRSASSFCYKKDKCGPLTWGGVCKSGDHPSPIDLPLTTKNFLAAQETKKPLTFNEYYHAKEFYILNNGHSVQVSFNENMTSKAEMTGYGVEKPYIFAQLHFHWGHKLDGGSEHTINGIRQRSELHFVHYSSKYDSFFEAATSGDPMALAVVGVFLSPTHQPSFMHNPAFKIMADNFPSKPKESSDLIKSPLNLAYLLPSKGDFYYRYIGSLTTPGCNEIVMWTVMAVPINVGAEDFNKFHDISDAHGERMGYNFRPTQPLGDRKLDLYRNY